MATYQSRHQPRRHLIVTGKVLQPQTYDRWYDMTTDALNSGAFPTMQLPAGQRLLRAAHARFSIEQVRVIPPHSAMSGDNRFSGRRLDGRPGQAALYLGTVAGSLREHVHYAMQDLRPKDGFDRPLPPPLWQPGAEDSVRGFVAAAREGTAPADGKHFHLFCLARPLNLADVRPGALAPFMARLQGAGGAGPRYGIASHAPPELLASAVANGQDYSAARGMADAVADSSARTGLAGVCALSARADTDTGLVTETYGDRWGGLVVALFGTSGQPVPSVLPLAPAKEASFDSLQAVLASLT